MRPGAKAFRAHDKATGEADGYILGYEVYKIVSLENVLTLRGLSGSHRLDYLCDDGKRDFYCDTLWVDPHHRKGKNCREFIETSEAFDFAAKRNILIDWIARCLAPKRPEAFIASWGFPNCGSAIFVFPIVRIGYCELNPKEFLSSVPGEMHEGLYPLRARLPEACGLE